jgi:hypothetical protein
MNQESTTQPAEKIRIFGLVMAGIFGLMVALQVLAPVLDNPAIVQDDFRQTNFWFWQFWDTSLFVDDFFAETMQEGFKLTPLYGFIWKSIMPALFSDLIYASKFYALVISVLGSLVAFLLIEKLTNSKNIFLSLSFVLVMSVVFWCTDHVSAAHVRSSTWLMLLLYLWLKSSGRDIASGMICLPMLFFNPTAFLICMGAEGYSWLARAKDKLLTNTFYIGILNAVVTLLFHFVYRGGVKYSGLGKSLTADDMKRLAEFNPGGRHPVFGSSLWDGSWWTNEHWGFGYGYLEISKVVFVTIVIAILYFVLVRPNFAQLKTYLESSPALLFFSSLTLYLFAQPLFPLLYFPSRYISLSSILIAVIISYLCISQILSTFWSENKSPDKLSRTERRKIDKNKSSTNTQSSKAHSLYHATIFVIIAIAFWWHFSKFYHPRFVSMNPQVMSFISKLPPDSMLAGHPLLPDLNSASILTKRKVYVDFERSIGFTDHSIEEVRKRTKVALAMTYAKSKEEFVKLARENGISHFAAYYDLYAPAYLANPRYINPFNEYLREITQIKPGETFFLQKLLEAKGTRYMIISLSDNLID